MPPNGARLALVQAAAAADAKRAAAATCVVHHAVLVMPDDDVRLIVPKLTSEPVATNPISRRVQILELLEADPATVMRTFLQFGPSKLLRVEKDLPMVDFIRCACGRNYDDHTRMVCCDKCNAWQHYGCVMPAGVEVTPDDPFHCERCRGFLTYPFAETARLFNSVLSRPSGPNNTHHVDFKLRWESQNFSEVLRSIRAGAMGIRLEIFMVGDPVPNRMNFPKNLSVSVDGVEVDIRRSHSSDRELGHNCREVAIDLTNAFTIVILRDGHDRFTLRLDAFDDQRSFIAVARVVRLTPAPEHLLARAETIEEAVARMAAQFVPSAAEAGEEGNGMEVDGVQLAEICVSLLDPFTLRRVIRPGRVVGHEGCFACFDLDDYLTMAKASQKFVCAHCLEPTEITCVGPDTYFEAVLQALHGHPEVTEVQVGHEGKWRPSGWERWFTLGRAGPSEADFAHYREVKYLEVVDLSEGEDESRTTRM